jgi:hypothetical protein
MLIQRQIPTFPVQIAKRHPAFVRCRTAQLMTERNADCHRPSLNVVEKVALSKLRTSKIQHFDLFPYIPMIGFNLRFYSHLCALSNAVK